MRKEWGTIAKEMQRRNPDARPYKAAKGDADFLSIFDGPAGSLNKQAVEQGLTAMLPVDLLAAIPYQMLNDVHFSTLVVAVLDCCPGLVMFAPDCSAWCMAAMFNNRNERAMEKIKRRRAEQTNVMQCVNVIIRAVWSYGGHVIIENPRHSLFWKQEFCDDMQKGMPPTHTLRDFTVNFLPRGWDILQGHAVPHFRATLDD
jgi:hypothetical protein